MNFMSVGNLPPPHLSPSALGCANSKRRLNVHLASVLSVASLGIGLVAGTPAHAAPFAEGVEQYRAHLIQDVDHTLTSAQKLRAIAAAGDLAGARQAWIEARTGWERSEVFTTGFVPELDRDIDAWPNGVVGFHAIEAKLFGANRLDVEQEVGGLLANLLELSTTVR